jgi:hypothetical protein
MTLNQSQIAYVAANLHRYNKAAEVYNYLAQDSIRQATGVFAEYPRERWSKWKFPFGIEVAQDEWESVVATVREILKKNGLIFSDMHAKQCFDSLFNYHWFSHVGGNEFKIGGNEYFHSNLFGFLDYLVTGDRPNDHSRTNKFLDANPHFKAQSFEGTFENLSIKKFLNGKFIIKGLNENQLARLEYVKQIMKIKSLS